MGVFAEPAAPHVIEGIILRTATGSRRIVFAHHIWLVK